MTKVWAKGMGLPCCYWWIYSLHHKHVRLGFMVVKPDTIKANFLMKGAELSYKLFLFTRSLPLWPSTEHCEPWIVLWLYSTPRIASDKSWDKFWEWDTKSKHGNRLEELLVFWCWTYRKNGQTNIDIVIFILAGIRGTSFGTLFWKMISSWFTSSSRASRWRKFQKKKELYSKERICL